MSQPNHESMSRRRFIKTAALTAVAATATGAGAALLQNPPLPAPAISSSPVELIATQVPTAITESAATGTDPLTRLAAAQAENIRLQAALDAAQRQLEALQTGVGATTEEAEVLRLELDGANQRLGILGGLLSLYEELDGISLDHMVQEGVTAVTGELTQMLEQLPVLGSGLLTGRTALDTLDAEIPLLLNGRAWLITQITKLQTFFTQIETLLADVAEAVAPFLEMFADWMQKVLRWLPFGLGESTSKILNATVALLSETPATISGLRVNVVEPLDLWLGNPNEDRVPLRTQVLQPLREQVLTPSEQLIARTRQMETAYQQQLAQPAVTAVTQRQAVQQLIATYRQQHQI